MADKEIWLVYILLLENNEKVEVAFPDESSDEFFEQLERAMLFGEELHADDFAGEIRYGGNVLEGLNGKKIVGYNYEGQEAK